MTSCRRSVLFSKRSEGEISNLLGHESVYEKYSIQLMQSVSVEDFNRKIVAIMSPMGLSDFSFKRIGIDEKSYDILSTLPDEFLRVYSEEKFSENDWMVAYAIHNGQPIFSSQVYRYICNAPFETHLTAINRSIEKLYGRFGFYDFYSIPMHSYSNNGRVQFAVASKGLSASDLQSKIEQCRLNLQQLCKAIDYVICVRFSKLLAGSGRQVLLTPKPLQILNRLANTDLTIAELATELCISPITAHQHIAGARRALGVKTNIGAIKKAVKLKLISFH